MSSCIRSQRAEINGVVKYGELSKGQRKIYNMGDDGEER
jgi:DNA-directed RNA polymerase subunit beta'